MPDYHFYPNIATAFMDLTRRAGGMVLFQAVALLLVVASLGAGLAAQGGAARLLFGMGRDCVISRRFFAYLHALRNTPSRNIWLIGILAYVGAQVLSYELTVEILNFRAFLGFVGVNLAVMWQFWVRGTDGAEPRGILAGIVLPALGFFSLLSSGEDLPLRPK